MTLPLTYYPALERPDLLAPVVADALRAFPQADQVRTVGLPASWPVLVDDRVAKSPSVVIGSGVRGSKLWLPGSLLAELPGAEVLPGLGIEAG
jgi:hypothetical protein